jgi:hypothetical protein
VAKKGGKKTSESCLPKKKLPKKKCCVSKDKCRRCPLLALKLGTLPEGYTVKKRKLVKTKKTKLPDAA